MGYGARPKNTFVMKRRWDNLGYMNTLFQDRSFSVLFLVAGRKHFPVTPDRLFAPNVCGLHKTFKKGGFRNEKSRSDAAQ